MRDVSFISPECGIHGPGGVGGDFRWCVEEQFSNSCGFIFMITSSP